MGRGTEELPDKMAPELQEYSLATPTNTTEKLVPHHVSGTVNLYVDGRQRFIPIPSSDPLGM